MSTTTSPQAAPLDISRTAGIPFTRLVRVEWRKMLDTRGGFWLLMVTGLLLLITIGLTVLIVALDDTARVSSSDLSTILTIPLSLLLPVFAILTVTSEWSQRTGLVTFALEPHRIRVLLAKLAAVVLLVLATILLAVVLGAIANVLLAAIGDYDAVWNLDAKILVLTVVVQLIFFLMAFGFGMAFLNTPAAIAVFYVVGLFLPLMVYGTLYAFFDWAQDVIPWIDIQFATAPFLDTSESIGGIDVARLISAVTLWLVIPGFIGVRRVLRSEPK